MDKNKEMSISKTLCYLLRHNPEGAQLDMDKNGYVNIDQLIRNLSEFRNMTITRDELNYIVYHDDKSRYYIKGDMIKCCQGHSLDWIVPEFVEVTDDIPEVLYHGTTKEALDYIIRDGKISKMKRQFVHLSPDIETARMVAIRRKKDYMVLEIAAKQLVEDGFKLYVSENGVYQISVVPANYIATIYEFEYDESSARYTYFETYDNKVIDNWELVNIAKVADGVEINPLNFGQVREYAESCKGICEEIRFPSIEYLLQKGLRQKAIQVYNRRHPDLSRKECVTVIDDIYCELRNNRVESDTVEE